MNTSTQPSKWSGASMTLSTATAPLLLTLGLVCGGCATTTGTPPGRDRLVLSGIRTLGLSVRAEQDFEVRFAREGHSGVGLRSGGAAAVSLSAAGAGAAVVPGAAIVAAVIGDVIEAEVRSSKDQGPSQELRTQLGQFDCRDFVEETLLKHLRAAELVPSVERLGAEAGPSAMAPPVDAVFAVDIKQWGLRPCSPPQPGKEVQVGLLVNLR
jgi:hypothetical protein